MGVPRLFPYIQRRFYYAIKEFQQGEYFLAVDNLYLDANAILHVAAQHVFNYGSSKRVIDPYVNLSYKDKLLKTFETFFEQIKELSSIVIPQKLLYIAIDGSAPLAKQAQQRQRRFVSAKENLKATKAEKTVFDSNSISPGTKFMLELTKYINYMIRREMNTNLQWQKLKVIFSSHIVPGEGEHKIMEYIREIPEKERLDLRHCFFSPDADVIMLTLAAHVPKIWLLKKNQFNVGYYFILNMGEIHYNFRNVFPKKYNRNTEGLVNDFIFTGFFVGNDFIPKIQMFMFLEEGLELMIDIYNKIFSSNETNFLTHNSLPNITGFTKFIEELAKYEVQYLEQQASVVPLNPIFKDQTLLKNITKKENKFILDFENYRIDYYKKANIDSEEDIMKMCNSYIKTIFFIYEYYVNKLPSWTFYYPYHYAPLMTDLSKAIQNSKSEVFTFQKKGKPSLPFVQLLSVLPPSSANLLPLPFHKLMKDPTSKLANIYPLDFDINCEGKLALHTCVVLLPFVNIKKVRHYYKKIKLKNYYVRNTRGKNYYFIYDKNFNATFTSDYGNIQYLHIKKLEL